MLNDSALVIIFIVVSATFLPSLVSIFMAVILVIKKTPKNRKLRMMAVGSLLAFALIYIFVLYRFYTEQGISF